MYPSFFERLDATDGPELRESLYRREFERSPTLVGAIPSERNAASSGRPDEPARRAATALVCADRCRADAALGERPARGGAPAGDAGARAARRSRPRRHGHFAQPDRARDRVPPSRLTSRFSLRWGSLAPYPSTCPAGKLRMRGVWQGASCSSVVAAPPTPLVQSLPAPRACRRTCRAPPSDQRVWYE